jgi:hypothetical protein
MKVNSIINHFDFLGHKQTFSIGSYSTYQTLFGSFCSFILSIIIFTYSLFLCKKVFIHKEPNIILTTYFDGKIPTIEFNQDTITMTVALQDTNYSYYINEQVYTVEVYSVTKKIIDSHGAIETIEEKLPLVKCRDILEFHIIPDYFLSLDLENLYCLNLNKTIQLEGEYGQKSWKYIQYRYKRCINSTLNNNSCLSSKEIDNKLRGGYLGLFIPHSSVVPADYDTPIKVYGKNLFSSFSGDYFNDIFMYLKTIEVDTDIGVLLKSFKKEKKICFSSLRSNTDVREGDMFLSFSIFMSQERDVYERSYIKLLGMVADIGGIIEVCMFLGEITVFFYRTILYHEYITSFFHETKIHIKKARTNYRINIGNLTNFKDISHNLNESNNNTYHYNHTNINISDYNCSLNCLNIDKNSSIHHSNNSSNRIIKNSVIHKPLYFNTNTLQSKNEFTQCHPTINNYLSNPNHICSVFDSSKFKAQKTLISLSKRVNFNSPKGSANEKEKDTVCQISQGSSKTQEINENKKIQLWMFLGPCLFNSKIKGIIKEIKKKYKRINLLFDILHYLKIQNDILVIKRIAIKENYERSLFKNYIFEMPTEEEESIFTSALNYKKRKLIKNSLKDKDNKNTECSGNDFINSKIQTDGVLRSDKRVITINTDK